MGSCPPVSQLRMCLKRSHQSTLNGPSQPEPTSQRLLVDADLLSPIWNGLSSSVECKQTVASSIPQLLFRGSPSTVGIPAIAETFVAVSTRIVTAIVYAVDAVLPRRSRPHISIEFFKGQPIRTDRDSRQMVAARVGTATIKHASPRHKFWRPRHVVCGIRHARAACATVRALRACTGPKICAGYSLLCSTFTTAKPYRLPAFIESNEADDGPPAERLSGEVYNPFWQSGRISFNHGGISVPNVVRAVEQHQLLGRSHFTLSG